jgi:putative cardiolipin synthase
MKKVLSRLVLLVVALMSTGCATLASREPVVASFALEEVTDTQLAQVAQRAVERLGTPAGFRLLPGPEAALDARIELVRRAERSIDLQYYIFRCDMVGLLLLHELAAAAERGVRVRLLVDDLHTDNDDDALYGFDALPNVEVRLFNPLPARRGGVLSRLARSFLELGRINHRMHNKLLVADNSLSISGGRNIGQEYFMRGDQANFIDLDILAAGPLVRDQSASFDEYWNSRHAYPIAQLTKSQAAMEPPGSSSRSIADLPWSGSLEVDPLGRGRLGGYIDQGGDLGLLGGTAAVLSDSPEKIAVPDSDSRLAMSVTRRALDLIAGARSEVIIVSPYLIPGEIGLALMRSSRDKGVRTSILTNSLGATDEPLVHLAYSRYREDMLRLGVRLYELSPTLSYRLTRLGSFGRSQGRLHAKVLLVDAGDVLIGSTNMDGRSAGENTEAALHITSEALSRDFRRLMDGGRFRGAYELRLREAGGIEWVDFPSQGVETVDTREPGATALTPWLRLLLRPLLPEELL